MNITPIAKIYTDFDSKFGVPRQPGLIPELKGKIVFMPEYRSIDSIRGLESFSHIWLIWEFSENKRSTFSPMVRPPRFGGNTRVGVFACRSPFRPNNLGLSCVKLESIDTSSKDAPVLTVSGIDMINETPIYDIKPYIPYSDCVADAYDGFATPPTSELSVVFDDGFDRSKLSEDKLAVLVKILSLDPRPHYQNDSRIYGMSFAGCDVKFCVLDNVIHVLKIESINPT